MRKQADAHKVCPIPDACLLVMAQRPYNPGIPDEVDQQLAIDLEDKRKRRAARMIKLKQEKKDLEQEGKINEDVGIKVLAEITKVKWEGICEKKRIRRHRQRVRRKEEKALREMETKAMLALGRRSTGSKNDRVLRPSVQLPVPQRRVPRRDDWEEMDLEEELRGLSGCGTGKVIMAESTIKGAGRGLYAIQEIREKGII
jgi:hypothetical protein